MKSTFAKFAGIALLVVLGVVAGYFAGKFGYSMAKDALSTTSVIALAILFIPLFLVVVGFHEMGHAIAGIWVKFDFRMYVIGPLMWEKEDAGWTFKWNRNVNTAGGMVICIPVGVDNLRRRFSVYAAGGPVASLLLATAGYISFRLLSGLLPSGSTIAQILLNSILLMSLLSAVIFLATVIPVHAGGFYSDGARILRLQRGGDTARFDILMLQIITSSTAGTRPAELAYEELTEALELARKLNAPFEVYLHSYFHQAAFDRGDIELAEKHLQDYVRGAESIPQGIRSVVWLDAAFFYAFARKDLQLANSYWDQFQPSAIIPKAQILATEAALAWLKKEKEIARNKTLSAISELPGMMDKGVRLALKTKLLRLKERGDE